ncbi:MAG: hypothetical protein CR982_01280 [Candidatus Cloacimonadota bacterium]|nr:MAG: hypothetical protein CR982_01280 [Candidatus Cloacimonadota bacterium]PIE77940.1 MAG: hypothetical protein CSA15_10360 [Candidatus Delongbacteria bacterium]
MRNSGFSFFNRNGSFTLLFIIITVGFIVYFNSFNCSFQYDDIPNIVENSDITNFSDFSKLSYWTHIYNRPLPTLITKINYYFSGLNTTPYHIINLIIHLLSSITAFFFITQIFKSKSLKNSNIEKYKTLFALFTSLIFLVHPLQTQSVTYIIQRIEALAGFLYLLSSLLYLKLRMNSIENGKFSIKIFILFLLTATCGILTKQTFASLPIAITSLEIFFVRDGKDKPNKKLIFSYITILISIFFILAFMGILPKEREYLSRVQYLFTQFYIVPKYIQLFFLPLSQNIDYDYTLVESLLNIKSILGIIFIFVSVLTGIKTYKRYPLISFGIWWFYISIFLRSSIFPIRDLIYEHRVYTPLFGLSVILVNLIFITYSKFRSENIKEISIILSVVVLLFGIGTIKRNFIWKTELSLWEDSYSKSPNKDRVAYNLGLSYYNKKEYEKAKKLYKKAIKLNPNYVNPYHNLATIFMNQKKWDDALFYFTKADQFSEKNINTLYNLGTVWFYKGNFERSEHYYSKVLSLDPKNIETLLNLAKVMKKQENLKEAENYLLKLLKLDNNNFEGVLMLGNILYLEKRYDEAEKYYSIAENINPNHISIYTNLANISFIKGEPKKAVEYYDKALMVDPNFVDALFNKANVLYMTGDKVKALEYYLKTLKVAPNHKAALKNSSVLKKELNN